MLTALLKYSPLTFAFKYLDSEADEDSRKTSDDCMKIMTQASADFSLECFYDGDRFSAFRWAVEGFSFVKISLSLEVH